MLIRTCCSIVWALEAFLPDFFVHITSRYFSYFTNLTYIGICAYFFASGVQTLLYARKLNKGEESYPLQRWPRVLRYLHTLLLSTVVTFRECHRPNPIIRTFWMTVTNSAFLVTIVFWVLLASSSTFATPFSGMKPRPHPLLFFFCRPHPRLQPGPISPSTL